MYKKNDSQEVIAVCNKAECLWRIYAARYKSDGTFAIRKFNLEHSYGVDNLMSRSHHRVDVTFVSNLYRKKIRLFPDTRSFDMTKGISHQIWGRDEILSSMKYEGNYIERSLWR